MKCIMCEAHFTPKSPRSKRCERCRRLYNKNRRNELTKAKYQGSLSAPVIPQGYVYLKAWAEEQGHTPSGAQKIISKTPHVLGAIKVRNPRGGVDVWAVPEGTKWPN